MVNTSLSNQNKEKANIRSLSRQLFSQENKRMGRKREKRNTAQKEDSIKIQKGDEEEKTENVKKKEWQDR